jgi:ketosteroid isomerase-like protein
MMDEAVQDNTATDAAVEIVRTYLRLVEARDLDAASALLDDDVTITFPGGREFHSLGDLVASSGTRFRSVRKTFDHFDTATTDAHDRDDGRDHVVVYAFGTLAGTALDGTSFDSVRFLDRFELRGGRIVSQMVWNDLAEVGVVSPGRHPQT